MSAPLIRDQPTQPKSMFLLMDAETIGLDVLGLRVAIGPGASGSRLPSYPPRFEILDVVETWEFEADTSDLTEREAWPEEEVPPEDEPAPP